MIPEDIKRLNYIYYSSFRQFVKSPHSIFVCYMLFVLHLLKNIVCLRVRYKTIKEVLFFVPSANNKKSVRTILENLKLNNVSIWGTPKTDLPYTRFYFTSIQGLHLFHKLYKTSSTDDKRLIRQFALIFMNTYGVYKNFERIIAENPQLKLIVFSNDHINICRCLIEVAEKHGIKTLYVQHASITDKFPPLHFSYSFLDGKESYEKYEKIGKISGKVFLTGSPRFDELYDFKGATKMYEIGVALNMRDSCDKVMELCKYLQSHVSKSIIVRPHPQMGRLFDPLLFRKAGMDISDSTQESSFFFLSKVKFLVANESSIHLDAALIGVPSLLFNFSSEKVCDWYSYIKNGMIQVCDNYDDVVKVLKNRHGLPVANIQYYNASFQTPIEGKVGCFIATFIERFFKGSETDALKFISSVMENKKEYYAFRNL